MARTDPQVNFRIPAELNERLKEAAEVNNRSITAELVSRIELSFVRNAGPRARLSPELISELSAAVSRSSLPQPEWDEDDFANWAAMISLADFSLFFALLSKVDASSAAAFHEAFLRKDWQTCSASWQKFVSLLGGAPPIQSRKIKQPTTPSPVVSASTRSRRKA